MKIENSVKEISHFLSEKGIKPSYQRVKILERLLADKNHHILVGFTDNKIVCSCVILIIPNLTHSQRP